MLRASFEGGRTATPPGAPDLEVHVIPMWLDRIIRCVLGTIIVVGILVEDLLLAGAK